jgi:hypothetical protein
MKLLHVFDFQITYAQFDTILNGRA